MRATTTFLFWIFVSVSTPALASFGELIVFPVGNCPGIETDRFLVMFTGTAPSDGMAWRCPADADRLEPHCEPLSSHYAAGDRVRIEVLQDPGFTQYMWVEVGAIAPDWVRFAPQACPCRTDIEPEAFDEPYFEQMTVER